MPAGVIDVTLPAPEEPRGPKAVIFEPAARLPRAPTLGAAWERVGKNLASAFARGGIRGALTSAGARESLGAALGRSALSAARGVAGLLLAEVTAKVAARFVVLALAQTQIPEVGRLVRAMGQIGGSAAAALDATVIPALREVGPVLRAVERMPRTALEACKITDAAMRVMVDAARYAIAAALVPHARATIAKFSTTAGLERGGSTIQTPPISAPGSLAGFPDVAVSLAPGGLSFTEPQNVMAEDPQGSPMAAAEALVRGAGFVASGQFPAVERAVGRLMDSVAERAQAASDEARARLAASGAAYSGASIGGLDFPGLWAEMQAARLSDAGIESAHAKIVKAPLWSGLSAVGDATGRSLAQGFAEALGQASTQTSQFSESMAKMTKATMDPARLATDELNDAFSLDIEMIDRVTAGSERAARLKQVAAMSAMVVEAAIKGTIAYAKAVAESLSGNEVAAAAHFAAVGLYAVAGGLAVAAGGMGSGSRRNPGTPDDRTPQFGQVTELVVLLPGYSDPARIRDELARSIQSGGVGQGRPSFVHGRAQTFDRVALRALVANQNSAGAKIFANQPGFAFLGLVALALDFGDQIGGEAERVGRRVGREARRVFRHIGL